jgi:transcriptional regulator GlxA family with amidase domain
MKPWTVGILGFDGVAISAFAGPLETFAAAQTDNGAGSGQRCYDTMLIGMTSKTLVSESGVPIRAQRTFQNAPALDTIIIPGGIGLREPETINRISEWLLSRADRTRRMAAISAGIYPLAQTGLLAGRHVAADWRCVSELAQRFPKLHVKDSTSFLKDGTFYTCGGGSAGVEMSLTLINEDYGAEVALALARELVVCLRPSRGDEDYFDPLVYQSGPIEKLADLPEWILANIDDDLSEEVLAKRVCVSPRHFRRVFKSTFKSTPADFVERLRLSEARRRLRISHTSVKSIAAAVGYTNVDAFRRAFERRLGVSPSSYRRQGPVVRHTRFLKNGSSEREISRHGALRSRQGQGAPSEKGE